MTGTSGEYFQKKRIGITIDPSAFSEMQRYRSLYLLSGKTLVEVPTITDFVNGMLIFLYPELKDDYYKIQKGENVPYFLDYVKKYFGKLEVEKELDKEEYEDFISALPEDMFKVEVVTKTEERKQIRIGGYDRPSLYEPQTINMILNEEMVIWARKINKLLNDIFQNKVLYSLSDIVKATINIIMYGPWSVSYVLEAYIPHLYGIELKEFFEFYNDYLYGPESKVFGNPEYRNLIHILADKPIFDEFGRILLDKVSPDWRELSPKKISKLVDEIDNALPADRLWSYVTNFNYKKALNGFSYMYLALESGLSIPDVIDILYNERLNDLVGSLYDSRIKFRDTLNTRRMESYQFFLIVLRSFINAVYRYSLEANKSPFSP
jgi:hypothetical protein